MGFKDRRPLVTRGIRYILGQPPLAISPNASTANVIPNPGAAFIAKSTVAARVYKVANPLPGAVTEIWANMGTSGKGVSIQPVSTATVKMVNRATNVIALTTNYGKGEQMIRLMGLTSTSYAVSVLTSTR